jgi:hypothetical protein
MKFTKLKKSQSSPISFGLKEEKVLDLQMTSQLMKPVSKLMREVMSEKFDIVSIFNGLYFLNI